MFNRKLSFIVISLLFSHLSLADYPEKCPEVKVLAQTLIEMEFHGRRTPTYHDCLKKVKSTDLWVRPEQNDESMNKEPKVDHWIENLNNLKVTSVTPTKINERYEAKYTYSVGKRSITDSIILETYLGNMKKMVGCAAIVEAPKTLTLLKSCQ